LPLWQTGFSFRGIGNKLIDQVLALLPEFKAATFYDQALAFIGYQYWALVMDGAFQRFDRSFYVGRN
jgi:hypothetical protein